MSPSSPVNLVVRCARAVLPDLVPDSISMIVAVVEPDVILRYSIVQSLQRDGHTVLHAGTPGQALRLFRESAGPIALLLVSLDFPYDGGLKLCRKISTRRPHVKVLTMADSLATRRDAQAEDWEVMQKPFTAATLRRRVSSLLARRV